VCIFSFDFKILLFAKVDTNDSPIPINNNKAGSVIMIFPFWNIGARAYEHPVRQMN
jgi:hypothetical protein